VCATGTILSSYLTTKNYKCGKCVYPKCSTQQPCNDYGNGYLAYKVSKNMTDGTCQSVCAAGNSLGRYVKMGYKCGNCTLPGCPNQSPCRDFGNGLLGYSIKVVSPGGVCREVCAAGNTLSALRAGNYTCGKCPTPTYPSCPNQSSCKDFGNGLLGYSVKLSSADGNCRQICAAGTGLTTLFASNYKCGTCPPAPRCQNQNPCKDFGGGFFGYYVKRVGTDGRCIESCAGGTSLTNLLKMNYTCGEC
jgi:hypothetical protein